MRKKAEKLKLTTVSDLKKVAPSSTFGGPPECVERPLCLGSSSQKLYGLQFKKVMNSTPAAPTRVRRSSPDASTSACSSPGAA